MGAGRSRVIRLLLTESLMLACLGGLGGIAVAYGSIKFFSTFTVPSELPFTVPFRNGFVWAMSPKVKGGQPTYICQCLPDQHLWTLTP